MNTKELSERDICTKFITPALRRAGWDEQGQLRDSLAPRVDCAVFSFDVGLAKPDPEIYLEARGVSASTAPKPGSSAMGQTRSCRALSGLGCARSEPSGI